VSYSGDLHETTLAGAAVQSYSIDSGLVGLAWAGDVLYATSFSAGTIGEVTLAAPTATYTELPWSGPPPTGAMGALASDPTSGTLFLVTREGLLYSVAVAGGMAAATLIEDLNAVGYPQGALPDGMGWIGACATAGSLTIRFDDKATLGWAALPDSTYDVISGSFSTDLSANTWTGPGGVLGSMSCRHDDTAVTAVDTTGLEEPIAGSVSFWLVRPCAGSWSSPGSVDRDADVLCP
jgi:hypothetical protein